MQIDINKLESGDRITFSERVEKIVSNICRDNGETRAVSFTDGTILDGEDSLWELAELPGVGVIWERDGYWDLGYTSVLEKNLQRARFILNMESSGGWRLEEILKFDDQRSAVAHTRAA